MPFIMFASWALVRLETSPGEMAAASPVEEAEDSVVEEADAGADVVSNKDGAAATAIASSAAKAPLSPTTRVRLIRPMSLSLRQRDRGLRAASGAVHPA
jgi:hypothetical protein